MEIKGRIIKVLPVQSGDGNNGPWKKQEFVIEFGDQYPKIVCFSLRGNRIDQFPINLHEQVMVSFDLESREYNGRYYTDAKAWKVERLDAETSSSLQAPNESDHHPFQPKSAGNDMPF